MQDGGGGTWEGVGDLWGGHSQVVCVLGDLTVGPPCGVGLKAISPERDELLTGVANARPPITPSLGGGEA